MTTLEKLAAKIKEQEVIAGCEYNEELEETELILYLNAESPVKINADISDPASAEQKAARWAVKLVAEGLTPQIDEWERHIKGAQDGLTESDLLMNVAYKLLDLITEASEKQAEEGSDGR